VPQASAPARRAVIPGLVGGQGSRSLTILAPGDADATVTVRVLGRQEDFAPQGADVVQVPAGRLVTVDLTDAIDGEAVSLALESDVPVTAGAFVRRSRPNTFAEFAWAAAVPPVAGIGGVATSRIGGGWDAFLMLAAADEDAQVDLQLGVPGNRLRTERISVPAGRVRVVPVGVSQDPAFRGVLVVPVPGSGPVHAARLQQFDGVKGVTVTSLPVRSLRVEVPVPEAAPDLSAGLSGAGD
jgi:hypothetical protein